MSSVGIAQEPAGVKPAPKKSAHELRRDWIVSQVPTLITDKAELRKFIDGLETLNEFEMNEVASEVLDALEQRRRGQLAVLRAVNARERAVQAQRERLAQEQFLLQQQAIGNFFPAPPVIGFVREPVGFYPYPPAFFPSPAVGYFPVVAWLPAGASLSAQAVISADGRHVRTSLMPFFSTIGPVHTFDFRTGETRRLPQYDPPRDSESPPAQVYDGLRTRNDGYRRQR